MSKLYILMRVVSDFAWGESSRTILCMSSDKALLDRIAKERNAAHRYSRYIYEYVVTEYNTPITIESEKDFYDTYREDIFDYLEDL